MNKTLNDDASGAVSSREVSFSCIKVNMFGMKQSRRVVIEHPAAAVGVESGGGRISIITDAGKTRRVILVGDIAGVERVTLPAKASAAAEAEAERSVSFCFLSKGEAKRRLVFSDAAQRDSFLKEIDLLSPSLVKRRLDGTLATTEDAQSDEDRIKRAIAASLTSVSAKSLSFADMGEFGDDAESDEEEDEEGGGVVGAPPRPSFTTKCGRCSRPRRLASPRSRRSCTCSPPKSCSMSTGA